MAETKHWSEISPSDAVGITLPHEGIRGPMNEMGEECPWPWDPQQLVGAPIGQYHCPACGGMVVAGMPHLDHRGATAVEQKADSDLPKPFAVGCILTGDWESQDDCTSWHEANEQTCCKWCERDGGQHCGMCDRFDSGSAS